MIGTLDPTKHNGWNLKNATLEKETPLQRIHFWVELILLTEEILHHLGCIKPCK